MFPQLLGSQKEKANEPGLYRVGRVCVLVSDGGGAKAGEGGPPPLAVKGFGRMGVEIFGG